MEQGRLYCYALFHGNLAFSSIPPSQYPEVVDRCYWPAVEMAGQSGLPLAFEFPASTLELVTSIDPSLIGELRRLWQSGRIDIVGSGYMQSIAPLMPAAVNAWNIRAGNDSYERLLGRRPDIALVNEQAYSGGIVGHFADAGYRALIMDWHNPTKFQRFPAGAKYRPQRVRGGSQEMGLLWSHTIAFQKFQRCVHGLLPVRSYLAFVLGQHDPGEERAFSLYTNDLEVFDYRPGQIRPGGSARGSEFARVRELLETLLGDDRVRMLRPSEILDRFGLPEASITLQSAEQPIPCKKQARYSITRWAVCGRDNALLNAHCYELYALLCQAEAAGVIAEGFVLDDLKKDLAYLWSSDFRTNTTIEKTLAFYSRYGASRARAKRLLGAAVAARHDATSNLVLVNPHPFELPGAPVEVPLSALAPGRFPHGVSVVRADGTVEPCQLDDVRRYRDGSVRSATLVLQPRIAAGMAATYSLGPATGHAVAPAVRFERDEEGVTIQTPAVSMRLSARRGATIESLAFPAICDRPLVGTVAHGQFEDISYGADFYTGHMVLCTREGRKVTDLEPADFAAPDDLSRSTLRIPIRAFVHTEVGTVCKRYDVYVDRPQVDLTYELHMRATAITSLRLGYVTALPDALDPSKVRYATTNGGREIDELSLAGKVVNHGEPVSILISARQCVGATEGWVSVHDDDKGVAIFSHRQRICPVPMLEHRQLEDGLFLRVAHSVVEQDETTMCLWRGMYQARFTILGHRCDLEAVRRDALSAIVPPAMDVREGGPG